MMASKDGQLFLVLPSKKKENVNDANDIIG